MYGMDLSNYQWNMDLSKGTYDFCIIKATEGVGTIDGSFKNFAFQLTELNKLIGCYHFARPDLHTSVSSMEKEADHFCSVVSNQDLLNKAILVLDWETQPMDRPDLIEAWTSEVEKITGIIPFIYGSRSKLTKWKDYNVVKSHPIWMAVWPNIQRYYVGIDPRLPEPSQSPLEWKIWQYSSTGKFPNFSGNVDLDYCKLTPAEWRKYAGMREEKPREELSEYMKWAIDIGLFVGYGDGTYRPNEVLTRNQAAILFYQYNKYLEDNK